MSGGLGARTGWSPLELGIRLINWSITWQLLGGMRAKDCSRLPTVRRSASAGLNSIYQHVRMIVGNLSRPLG